MRIGAPRPVGGVALMGHVHLGIDLGTSSVKALVTDDRGDPLGSARASYPVDTPRSGHAESDPARWWQATCEAVRAAVGAAGRSPTAIGLSGQMHGLVLADDVGRPLRPAMLWPDTRAQAQLQAYRQLPDDAAARLANPLSPGMAGPLLRWVADHEATSYRAARWALQPKDWLRLRLTGRAAAEPSDASATLLYDVPGDRWDLAVVTELGLDARLLPPLVPSATAAGDLTADAAADLDLDVGLPVAAGAGDTAAAAIGTGLIEPGIVQLTVGTGGQLVTPTDRAMSNAHAGTHLYRSALAEGWYAMAATLNAGLALGWVRELFGVQWPDLYAAATQPCRADDPLFVPHLVGERTPYLDPRLRGGWSDLGLSHDRSALFRAALEGVAFALRDALEVLPVDGGGDTRLRLAGGGSQDAAWRQLLADVLDRPLDATEATDASARGAALLSALASGEVTRHDVVGPLAPAVTPVAEPRRAQAALHRERFGRYRAQVRLRRP